jgi:hypothetical protein
MDLDDAMLKELTKDNEEQLEKIAAGNPQVLAMFSAVTAQIRSETKMDALIERFGLSALVEMDVQLAVSKKLDELAHAKAQAELLSAKGATLPGLHSLK